MPTELDLTSVTWTLQVSSLAIRIRQHSISNYILGNSLGATGQTNLSVTNNVPGVNGFSQAKTEDFNITVTMPTDLTCTGGESTSLSHFSSSIIKRLILSQGSTGNICTVRCRNNALAGPFGGCFAVQQVDTTPSQNTASNIETAQTLEGIQARKYIR